MPASATTADAPPAAAQTTHSNTIPAWMAYVCIQTLPGAEMVEDNTMTVGTECDHLALIVPEQAWVNEVEVLETVVLSAPKNTRDCVLRVLGTGPLWFQHGIQFLLNDNANSDDHEVTDVMLGQAALVTESKSKDAGDGQPGSDVGFSKVRLECTSPARASVVGGVVEDTRRDAARTETAAVQIKNVRCHPIPNIIVDLSPETICKAKSEHKEQANQPTASEIVFRMICFYLQHVLFSKPLT
ncbi:hypothetical protein BJ742DRAFT_741927 [Cladochytrium replicatum]|nr:hypothetical protein BJ742DRAFT_741927 [Cladochytrium replicatum]